MLNLSAAGPHITNQSCTAYNLNSYCLFSFLFLGPHCSLREIQVLPYLGKAQQLQSSTTHLGIPVTASVHALFCVCPNKGMAARLWGAHWCWCMWLHTWAVQTLLDLESLHWKLTPGEKSLAAPGTQIHASIAACTWISNQALYQLMGDNPFFKTIWHLIV